MTSENNRSVVRLLMPNNIGGEFTHGQLTRGTHISDSFVLIRIRFNDLPYVLRKWLNWIFLYYIRKKLNCPANDIESVFKDYSSLEINVPVILKSTGFRACHLYRVRNWPSELVACTFLKNSRYCFTWDLEAVLSSITPILRHRGILSDSFCVLIFTLRCASAVLPSVDICVLAKRR